MARSPVLSPEMVASTCRVLDAVRVGGCETRGAVVAATGLAKALVSERLRSLIGWGLVREEASRTSSGGRPAQQLSVAADLGYVLVVEMGMTHLTVAAADLAGRIRGRRSMPTDLK